MYDICFVVSYEKYIAETISVRTGIFFFVFEKKYYKCVLNAPYMWT